MKGLGKVLLFLLVDNLVFKSCYLGLVTVWKRLSPSLGTWIAGPRWWAGGAEEEPD